MKKNMGVADRSVRVVVALILAGLVLTGTIGGGLAVVLSILAVVFLLTSLLGTCPAYTPLGVSTLKSPGGPKPTR